MGFSSIVGAIVFIFIFAGMVMFMVTIQKNAVSQAQAQSLAAARERVQGRMAITITGANYGTNAIIPWIDTTYADFAQGAASNVAIASPGTLTLVGPVYNQNGTWTSPVIDTGAVGTNYTTISWSATLPAGTVVAFQTRAGASIAALQAAAFTGPDGTAGTSYTVAGTTLNDTVNDQNRYIQYAVGLETTNPAKTPQISEVQLGVQRFIGVTTVTARNTGSEKLVYNTTDIYLDGTRVPRSKADRTFDLGSATDQILWLPGVELTAYVFGDLTTPTPVIVANGAAQGAGTVS